MALKTNSVSRSSAPMFGLVSVLALALTSCGKPAIMTQSQYDRVTVGMPWENMAKIATSDPNDMTAMTIPGLPAQQTFIWKNADGSTALITSGGGKVIAKSQLGALPDS